MTIRLMAVIVALFLYSHLAFAQAGSCLAPGDSSVVQLNSLRQVMDARDTTSLTIRTYVGLSGLDTTDMHLVQAEALCARLDSAMMNPSTPQTLRSYVVYALGVARYAVFSPGPRYTTVYFVDDQKRLLALLGI